MWPNLDKIRKSNRRDNSMQDTEKCNDSRIVVFSISQMRSKQKKVHSANLLAKQPKNATPRLHTTYSNSELSNVSLEFTK